LSTNGTNSKETNPKSSAKLSFKEQKELESIPAEIDAYETEQQSINMQLADGELYKHQPETASKLQARLQEIDIALEALLARWEMLESKKT
jgi:ATP-binding cassette subfamily F protein uup